MKHISICAILGCLLLQNEASAASPHRSVKTRFLTFQELARYKEATDLDSDFLKGMDISRVLDLSSLKHVSVIGDGFLNRSLIERIVFPPNVRTIGINFLSQCANLNEVDLSAFVKVITIENGFFAACTNLKKVNMPKCMDATHIKNDFFSYCENLTDIDFSALNKLTHIGNHFLTNCKNLREIDFSAFKNVRHIGRHFLTGCTKLEKVILPYNKAFESVDFPKHVNIFFADDMHMRAPSAAPYATMPPFPAPYSVRTPSAAPYATTTAAPTLQEFVERYKSATVLDSDFLKGMDISGILDLSSFEHLSVIGDDFLRDQKTLTGIILPANLTRIRSNFLANCENLKEIDLSALNKVTRIGPNFLEGCAKLKKVILPFNKAFESVVFPPTVNMIYSQVLILQDGTLKTPHPRVNLPLSFVDEDFNPVCIPLAFYEQSTTNIFENYVAPPIQEYYKNVISSTIVSNFYLSVFLNLSSLRRVEHIDNDVFVRRDAIAKITLPASLISIGESFLSLCKNITEVDFSPLTEVTHIGKNLLRGCKALKEFYWHDFTRLMTIEEGFLAACANLRTVNLFGFTQVTSIEDSFMAWCANLTNLKLSNLRKLTHIGPNFLGRCENLTILDLSALEKLTHIGPDFLKGCTNLKELDLSAFENVTTIGSHFLEGCTNLKKVILPLNNMAFNTVQFPPSVTNFPGIAVITKDGTFNISHPRVNHILSITYDGRVFHAVNINLQGLRNTREICSRFLAGFARLHNVDLSPLEDVERIDDGFLSGCRSIENLTI